MDDSLRAQVIELLDSLSGLRAEGKISGLDVLECEKRLKKMLPDERKMSPGPVDREWGMKNCVYGQFESKRSRH